MKNENPKPGTLGEIISVVKEEIEREIEADEACYLGKITRRVYKAALRLRGDDDTCWGERVRLSEPALSIPEMPEEEDGDTVIEIWEKALADAREECGEGNFVLESVTLYLDGEWHDFQIVWEPNVRHKS